MCVAREVDSCFAGATCATSCCKMLSFWHCYDNVHSSAKARAAAEIAFTSLALVSALAFAFTLQVTHD